MKRAKDLIFGAYAFKKVTINPQAINSKDQSMTASYM